MSKLELLQPYKEEAANCIKCELHKNRIKSVFSRGNPETKIIFCGEAGGRDENSQGLPFVGRSGDLLNNVLEKVGIKQEDIYIFNTVCCSPPNNRKPLPEEMLACSPFFKKQIEIVNPKLIVALGATAALALTGSGDAILRRAGTIEKYGEIPVLLCVHPSYCLRNPNYVENMVKVMEKVKNLI